MRNKLIRLFEANDGRRVSSQVLFVRKGERVKLVSNGWDCDLDGDITVYNILHYPENHCDEAVMSVWTKDVECSPLETVEVPRVRLTKANTHDIIDVHGQYLLVRERDALEVNVFAKYDRQP